MKKFWAWLLAGVIAACLAYLVMFLIDRFGVPHLKVAILAGDSGLRFLGWQALWGAGYGLLFGFILQHLFPKEIGPGALLFAVVPFLVEVLVLPLSKGHPAVSEPWKLLWLAVDNILFSLIMVALGRQMEK